MQDPMNPSHKNETRPLKETIRAVSDWATASIEQLNPDKKSFIRKQVLSKARENMSMEKPVQPAKTSKSSNGFRFPVWPSFAIAGMAAVLLIAIVVNMSPARLPSQNALSILRALEIPAVHAADAFTVLADQADAAGMSTDSSLTVTSKIDVSADDLRQALRIVPSVDVELQKQGDKSFKILPKEELSPGTIYRVSIATKINENGESLAREFSWALQTKNDFRIISSIPADGAARVPTSTGIEFKLSRDGWVDPASFFSMTPAVEGSFISKGRLLTFVPKKPLDAGTRYEVVLKKGFNISGSEEGLKEDARLRFETDIPSSAVVDETIIVPVGERYYFEPNKSSAIALPYGTPESLQVMRLTGFRLSKDEAKTLLTKRLNIPSWTYAERIRYEDFEQAAKTQAFQIESNLINENYQKSLLLPGLESGFYAVRFDPITSGKTKPSWAFIQVNSTASYLKADKDTLLVWAVNTETNRSLSNTPLKLNEQVNKTDASGLGKLQTPTALTGTSTKGGDVYPFEILEVGEGKNASLMVLRKSFDRYFFDFGNQDQFISDTASYLYLDRSLYRVKDELRFFGIAQDRETRSAPTDQLTIRLRKSSYWFDFGTGQEKIYQEIDVAPDKSGRFEGKMNWNELSQGYYSVELRRSNRTLATLQFEVREFVKPAYSIEVIPDNTSVYDNEKISGTVRARFFDGTPLQRQKLQLQSRMMDGAGSNPALDLETDSNGIVRFELNAKLMPCTSIPENSANISNGYYLSCVASSDLLIEAGPTEGEEGEIIGRANVLIRRSALGLDVNMRANMSEATASISTWRYSLTSEDNGKSNAWSEKALDITILPWSWARISTGFVYDMIEKKNIEQFRYEMRFDPAVRKTVTTNDRGQIDDRFTLQKDKEYIFIVDGRDDGNRLVREMRYVWPGGYGNYERYVQAENTQPSLALLPESTSDRKGAGYVLDQEVTAEFRIGNNPLDVSKTPGVLYLLASRGLKDAKVLEANRYPFRFSENLMPNAEVYGVTWQNGAFVEVRNTAFFRKMDRELTIEAKTDKQQYAPGENVTVNVTAKSKQTGEPVRDLKFSYSAVDKALLALTYDEKAQPIEWIYGYVVDGLIFGTRSHEATYDGYGGAEKGGGGLASLRASARTNFKDTAAFGVVNADNNGSASFTFKAPDNITGWRLELVGISSGLEAGSGRVDVNVTKPVFVESVLPPRLLVSDKPVLKLRAFGAGLPEGADVTFVVDAPTLGLSEEKVKGKASESTFVAIDKLVTGRHKMLIGIETAQGSDSLERTLVVDASRFTKNEFVSVDAAPGSAIPELGQAEAEIVLTAKNRASLMPYLYDLIWRESGRSDAKLAKRYAINTLRTMYKDALETMPTDDQLAAELAKYQQDDGTMMLLPYSSSDAELTAEVAASLPEYIDTQTMSAQFWQTLDDKSANREIQLTALSGLASLGEPVLPSLQAALEISDLTWREQLVIARGLVGIGDRERARVLLEKILEKSVSRDDLTRLEVSKEEMENIEAAADAAAIAASLAHPKAMSLRRYVDSVWYSDAFPVLAKVRFMKAVLPTVLDREIRLTYTLGTDDKELLFKDEPVQRITLTAEEARRFRVTSVDGPISITFNRRTPGKPESKPEVSITRTYTAPANMSLNDLREGDRVVVELRPTFAKGAIDGCYEITDNLPGGWQPIVRDAYRYMDYGFGWYPYEFGNGAVSFIACGTADQGRVIQYSARVVSRGNYTAEGALIQHTRFPSISSVSSDEEVTIK